MADEQKKYGFTTMSVTYIALDGDNVGKRLEYLCFTNDVSQLRNFSIAFSKKMNWLRDELVSRFNADVIIDGGDNLMISLTQPERMGEFLNTLSEVFSDFQTVGNTLSAGIGDSPRDAFIALNFAKSSGKDCIKIYGDYTDNGS
ncbi:MAG: mCpol domain-containing protein [Ardenticatenaceae bacterium]|nr:mCpol domain-containing protein [Ardenticatenaceae bacterium]